MNNRLSWRDVLRGKSSFTLHPNMLNSEGYESLSYLPSKNDSPGECKRLRKYHFDRDYVIAYIVAKIIKPLAITSFQQLEVIIFEAWTEYEKELQADR